MRKEYRVQFGMKPAILKVPNWNLGIPGHFQTHSLLYNQQQKILLDGRGRRKIGARGNAVKPYFRNMINNIGFQSGILKKEFKLIIEEF